MTVAAPSPVLHPTPSRAATPTSPEPQLNRYPARSRSGEHVPPDRLATAPPTPRCSTLADPVLAFHAAVLDDLEAMREATAARVATMTRTGPDADGIVRGFGMDPLHSDVVQQQAMADALADLEARQVRVLERALRAHPLGAWCKAQRGVGDKQAARLLAAVGDPYWNTLHDRPRTVSELWAYSGYHTLPVGGDQSSGDTQTVSVAARRVKGQKSNWSSNAKTRAWLIVGSCMRQIDPGCKRDTGIGVHDPGCHCSPYRVVVDERRTRTATTHPDWTPGHSLADGQRVAAKALLRDLWRAAHDHHQQQHW